MKSSKVDIDKLNREIFRMTHGDQELLDGFLQDAGYDTTELEKNGLAKVRALLFQTSLQVKKIDQQTLYAQAISIFECAKEETKHAILELLKVRAPKLQFNHLEKMEADDLKEILDETDLIDLMNKIDQGQIK